MPTEVLWQGGDESFQQIAFGSTPGLTESSVQNPQRLVLPLLAYSSPKVLEVMTKQSSCKSLSSERSVQILEDSSRMPKNGSAHISKEVPPGPATRHQVDSTIGQEASVSNPEEPAPRLARGSSQVLPRPNRPSRRCQSPRDSFRSSRPTSKKLRLSSVESVISVGEEAPMGNLVAVPYQMLLTTQRPTIDLSPYQQSGLGTNYRGPCSILARESRCCRITLGLILFHAIRESVWQSQGKYVPRALKRRAIG
jgi:hypothetical protein